jgi:hypothetical protein
MKQLLITITVLVSLQVVQYSQANIYVSEEDLPNHWDANGVSFYGGPIYQSTNYLPETTTYATNIYDLGLNIITNISIDKTQSAAEDYVAIENFYYEQLPNTFIDEVESGGLQLLELDALDNILGTLYTNYLRSAAANIYTNDYNGYSYTEGDTYPEFPTNFINITGYPTIATNGLVLKKFEFDWVYPPEQLAAIGPPNWSPGVWTDVVTLDNQSIRRVESFAVHNSPDLSFTTNIQYYLETRNPISAYSSGQSSSDNYFTSGGTPVSYVKLTARADVESESFLEVKAGEVAYVAAYNLPTRLNNSDWPGNFAFYVEVDYGGTGYEDIYSDNYHLKYINEPSTIIGPALIRLGFNITDWVNPSIYYSLDTIGYITYRIERTESSYLASLETLVEQLSNTVSQTETTTITNTVVNTITNTVGYTLSEVADMRYGSKMVAVSNNTANLTFRIDAVSNLESNWNPIMDITVPFDMGSSDIGFFRVRGADELTTNEVGRAASPPNMNISIPSETYQEVMENLHESFRNSTTTPDGGGFGENNATPL